jgi:hypothetical protein
MIAIIGILILVVVVGSLIAMRGSRRWVIDAGATEVRLQDPETHKLSYLVPDGQDPAALMAALAHTHFTTAVDTHGGIERLLVACEESDRAQVRQVLSEASSAGAGQTQMTGVVRFEDEPESAAS